MTKKHEFALDKVLIESKHGQDTLRVVQYREDFFDCRITRAGQRRPIATLTAVKDGADLEVINIGALEEGQKHSLKLLKAIEDVGIKQGFKRLKVTNVAVHGRPYWEHLARKKQLIRTLDYRFKKLDSLKLSEEAEVKAKNRLADVKFLHKRVTKKNGETRTIERLAGEFFKPLNKRDREAVKRKAGITRFDLNAPKLPQRRRFSF